mgnify:CR=1 FL=1
MYGTQGTDTKKLGSASRGKNGGKKGVNMELCVLNFSDDSIILQKNCDLCTCGNFVGRQVHKAACGAGYNCKKVKMEENYSKKRR